MATWLSQPGPSVHSKQRGVGRGVVEWNPIGSALLLCVGRRSGMQISVGFSVLRFQDNSLSISLRLFCSTSQAFALSSTSGSRVPLLLLFLLFSCLQAAGRLIHQPDALGSVASEGIDPTGECCCNLPPAHDPFPSSIFLFLWV